MWRFYQNWSKKLSSSHCILFLNVYFDLIINCILLLKFIVLWFYLIVASFLEANKMVWFDDELPVCLSIELFFRRLVQCSKSWIRRVCMQVPGTRMEESLPDRLINPCHYVDGSLSLAISTERFSSQAYLNAINDKNTTTL